MGLSYEHQKALEAELNHYMQLSRAQAEQLKQYAKLQQRSNRLLSIVIKKLKAISSEASTGHQLENTQLSNVDETKASND